ncbi:hypothetical protein LAZ67_12002925 [Cordylochernes scorpioides]|uniref:Uncharacterized protein n=1 Tax=Cordylochernes scorpioides TaxID=51811 RepID=A0ABY6L4K1_9ARAC|nr:hypothetical protein LAZ67_12002925 [Cordylochernes scorpioides]
MKDCRIRVQELANRVSIRTVHSILIEDLGMRILSAKLVPKLLAIKQKQQHLEVSQDMLNNANSKLNFLKTKITGVGNGEACLIPSHAYLVFAYVGKEGVRSSQWEADGGGYGDAAAEMRNKERRT